MSVTELDIGARPTGGPSRLMTVAEATQVIESKRLCWIAGDPLLLRQLPKGHWLAGSIHYFMTGVDTREVRDRLHVTVLPAGIASRANLRWYTEDSIQTIASDAPDHGFTIVIMPARSAVHRRYAEEAPGFPDMFMKPIAGWVSGVHLGANDGRPAEVFNGATGESASDRALALHVGLRDDYYASVGIFNAYRQGEGSVIEFPRTGFTTEEAKVDGRTVRFADFLRETQHDQRLPLVANYSGAMINVAIQEIAGDEVSFYAPVFAGISYRFAVGPLDQDTAVIAAGAERTVFACNCVLNYLHADPNLVTGGGLSGPMSFGEIAYQLLNQTMVYLTLEHA